RATAAALDHPEEWPEPGDEGVFPTRRVIVRVERERCIGCGTCLVQAPPGMFVLDSEGKAVVTQPEQEWPPLGGPFIRHCPPPADPPRPSRPAARNRSTDRRCPRRRQPPIRDPPATPFPLPAPHPVPRRSDRRPPPTRSPTPRRARSRSLRSAARSDGTRPR